MNKKFLVAVLTMFVLSMLLGFLIHEVLLGPDYAQLGALFRGPADSAHYFPWMLLAHVLTAVGFVWIYMRGHEDKPFLQQGLRYGLAVAVLATIPGYLIYYAVQPMPGMLVAKQIVFSSIGTVLMGIALARIYR